MLMMTEFGGNSDKLMTTGNHDELSSVEPITSSLPPSATVNHDNDADVKVTSPADDDAELVTTKKKTRKKRKSSRKSEETAGEDVTAEQDDKGLLPPLLTDCYSLFTPSTRTRLCRRCEQAITLPVVYRCTCALFAGCI